MTEKALMDLGSSKTCGRIFLLANLFQEDYARLEGNQSIDQAIFYHPHRNKLSVFRIIRLLFRLNRENFDQAVILVGDYVPGGYKKAKLLAVFSGAKRVKFYFIASAVFQNLGSFKPIVIFFKSAFSILALFFILAFFVIFIVIPLELKKYIKK
jgi:hypothetical protein